MKTKASMKEFRNDLITKTPRSQRNAHNHIFKIARKIFGFRVERERIFPPYIVDIYIKPLKTAIEIDGGIHKQQGGYDNRRDDYLLKKYGVRVFRFDNKEINTPYFEQAIWTICLSGLSEKIDYIKTKAVEHGIALSGVSL